VLVLGGMLFVAGRWQSLSVTAADVSPDSEVETRDVLARQPPPPPDLIEAEAPATTNAVMPEIKLTASVAEVVRLAQSGVDEEVLIAYIGTVKSRFSLGSDQIVYLNDVGISGAVVKAMIQRDAAQSWISGGSDCHSRNTPPGRSAPPYLLPWRSIRSNGHDRSRHDIAASR